MRNAYLEVTKETAGGLKVTRVECMFNPKEYSIDGTAQWTYSPAKDRKPPKLDFGGTQPRSMKLELFFDAWYRARDVAADIESIMTWLQPTPQSVTKKKPRPPVVVFGWGTWRSFNAHLKSASAKFLLFDDQGAPVRASVSCTLEEIRPEVAKQNPTSGSESGRRTRVLAEGESLHSIAWEEYDDPRLWRGIADLNGIDDPLRMRPGHVVVLPTFDEVAARS